MLWTTDAKGLLAGVGVLVTRPVHQAERLCRLLQAQGANTIRFPVIEIVEPRDPAAALSIIDELFDYDIAIFASVNAVQRALPLIRARQGLPAHLMIAAIGKATASALERFGVPPHLVPKVFSSEALLTLPELQALSGRRVVIFRGEGGRELLADALRARGASVRYAEVYRRRKPLADAFDLIQHWTRGEIHVAAVTSNEGLQNLFDIVGKIGQQWLRTTPLIVVSERGRRLAQELGFKQTVWLAQEASDEAIVETMLKWHQARFE